MAMIQISQEAFAALLSRVQILEDAILAKDRAPKEEAPVPQPELVEEPKAKKPKANKPVEKKKPASPKEKVDPKTLHNAPFDPTKCRRRNWRDGFNCQCERAVYEGGLCKGDYNKFTKDGLLPHGMYDEEKPLVNPKGGAHKWRDEDGEYPVKGKAPKSPKTEKKPKVVQETGPYDSLTVSELKVKLKELNLGVGGKKSDLIERLTLAEKADVPVDAPADPLPEGHAEQPAGPPDEDAQVQENQLEEDKILPDGDDELDEDDAEITYEHLEYEGVTYLRKDDVVFNMDYEEIGTWTGDGLDINIAFIYEDLEYQGVAYLRKGDVVYNKDEEEIGAWTGHVIEFTNDEAEEIHLGEKDEEDPELGDWH